MADHSRFHQEYPDGKPGMATGNPSGSADTSSIPSVKVTKRDGGRAKQISNRSIRDVAGDFDKNTGADSTGIA